MTDRFAAIDKELQRIAAKHDGTLTPRIVVDEARPKNSVLHSEFDWDDTHAAEEWRVEQARRLLRVTVELAGGKKGPNWVSLTVDRHSDEPVYRKTITVLSDRDRRQQLINDAMRDMEIFEKRYVMLRELAGVIAAMRKFKRNKDDTE